MVNFLRLDFEEGLPTFIVEKGPYIIEDSYEKREFLKNFEKNSESITNFAAAVKFEIGKTLRVGEYFLEPTSPTSTERFVLKYLNDEYILLNSNLIHTKLKKGNLTKIVIFLEKIFNIEPPPFVGNESIKLIIDRFVAGSKNRGEVASCDSKDILLFEDTRAYEEYSLFKKEPSKFIPRTFVHTKLVDKDKIFNQEALHKLQEDKVLYKLLGSSERLLYEYFIKNYVPEIKNPYIFKLIMELKETLGLSDYTGASYFTPKNGFDTYVSDAWDFGRNMRSAKTAHPANKDYYKVRALDTLKKYNINSVEELYNNRTSDIDYLEFIEKRDLYPILKNYEIKCSVY